ncbi:MAG: hypothetical protein AAF840_04320 [Bacteroidota bacterium]
MLLKSTLVTFILLFTFTTAAAQLVVKERPEVPAAFAKRTLPEPGPCCLITEAGWAVKDGAYTYLPAREVKKRPGFKYVPGKWKKVKGGWMYEGEQWVARR